MLYPISPFNDSVNIGDTDVVPIARPIRRMSPPTPSINCGSQPVQSLVMMPPVRFSELPSPAGRIPVTAHVWAPALRSPLARLP